MYNTSEIYTESDVEQKILFKLLTLAPPQGLGFDSSDVLTKPDIRKIEIDKGQNKKLYYPDYVVLVNGLPCFVIEAKAPNQDLDEAAREGRLYASEINSSFKKNINPCNKIIVSDGKTIKGYSWDNNTPLFSIEVSKTNPANKDFDSFIDSFSKKEAAKHANSVLSLLKKNATYFKPINMLGGKTVINQTVGQNSFGANVSLEYRYLFNPDSLEDRESIVRNAYVPSKRKQSHVAPIDKLIRASIPNSIVDATVISDTTKPSEIISELSNTKKVRNEICLLIGNVGSGKSTFTDYLRSIALPEPLLKHTAWLNINLNNAPLSRNKIYDWIISEINGGVKASNPKIDFDSIDTIKSIYAKELGRVKRGKAALFAEGTERHSEIIFQEIEKLENDKVGSLKSTIEYLQSSRDSFFIIVLDNCDKRGRDDQLLMFEVATWLKETLPCMIFLPLRDSTYDQYCNEPPLDTVIKDLVFRIDPPLLERVVYSRLKYAIREINNDSQKFYYYLPNNAKVQCDRNEVAEYVKCMVASLFQDHLFKRIITGLAGRNIRKGLEIFLSFCKSGYIGTDEIFKIKQANGDYTLPHHLVAKILLKGNRKFYDDTEAIIKNLFCSDFNDSLPDPFIRISILQWLKNMYREFGPNKTKGYHKAGQLFKDLQALGHSKDRMLIEIKELADANCVVAENQDNQIDEEDLISIAPAGFIHLDLLKNINYLSTISEDTFFRENQPAKKIADNITGKGKHRTGSKQEAISNSKVLINYMKSYYDDFFSGSALVRTGAGTQTIDILNELQKHIKDKADNDPLYSQTDALIGDYPQGKEVLAQIASIQTYGLFVEFDLNGHGLIHVSTFSAAQKTALENIEEGDWVIAKIITFKTEHNRFNLALVDVLE